MVSWCGHEELCINHSSLQLSVSSHTANAHWEWGDVSSSHTSRCRELSPPTAMGTLIICSCWIGKLHYSVPGNVLSINMTAVWIVRPGQAGICIKFMSLFGSFPLELSSDIVCPGSPVRDPHLIIWNVSTRNWDRKANRCVSTQTIYLLQPSTFRTRQNPQLRMSGCRYSRL